MKVALVMTLVSLVNGEVRPETLDTDATSIYSCYLMAPRIISAAMPEVLSDEGFGPDKLKMEKFICREN
jgi:hypothetical protein